MDDLLQKQSRVSKLRASLETRGVILFYLGLLLFLLVLATYGGLFILNRNQKSAQDELLAEIGLKEDELRPELINQIFSLEVKLKQLRKLLTAHRFTSNIFLLLEENTLPRVRFGSFSFTTDKQKVELNGEAVNYATLAQQIAILERHPLVEMVQFGGLSNTPEGLVSFKLSVSAKSKILEQRP